MTNHIVKSFDEQLHWLKQLVERMGKLTSERVKAALDAVQRSDRTIARRVMLMMAAPSSGAIISQGSGKTDDMSG